MSTSRGDGSNALTSLRQQALQELRKREKGRHFFRKGGIPDEFVNLVQSGQENIKSLLDYYSVRKARTMDMQLAEIHKAKPGESMCYHFSKSLSKSDFHPYDRRNALLGNQPEDFTNSSWVKGLYTGRWWFATRCPQTIMQHRFFSIFFRDDLHPEEIPNTGCRMRTIVQLNESSVNPKFTYNYLAGEPTTYICKDILTNLPPITVTIHPKEEIREINCVKRVITLTWQNQKVDINHLSILDWPTGGHPRSIKEHINFIKLVDKVNRGEDGRNPPMVIHCDSGIGRTGINIVADDIVFGQKLNISSVPRYKSPLPPLDPVIFPVTDIAGYSTDFLREMRPAMVQGTSRVNYLYDLQDYLRSIPSKNPIKAPIELRSHDNESKAHQKQQVQSSPLNISKPGVISRPVMKESTPVRSRPSSPTTTNTQPAATPRKVIQKSQSPARRLSIDKAGTSDLPQPQPKNKSVTPKSSGQSPDLPKQTGVRKAISLLRRPKKTVSGGASSSSGASVLKHQPPKSYVADKKPPAQD